MNYNYLYIFIYFLFTESIILRFTIRFYDSIRETLLTIQDRILILITMHPPPSQKKKSLSFPSTPAPPIYFLIESPKSSIGDPLAFLAFLYLFVLVLFFQI